MKSQKQLTEREWKDIRDIAGSYCKKDGVPIHAACVHHAMAAQVVLGCEVEAGSATWQFTNIDTGHNPTHFTYLWSDTHGTVHSTIGGAIPEVHVWNRHKGLILDMTTGYLPKQLGIILGLDWDAPKPPKYFWGRQRGLRQRWLYTPKQLATRMCGDWIEELIHKWGCNDG